MRDGLAHGFAAADLEGDMDPHARFVETPLEETPTSVAPTLGMLFGVTPDSVYLSPAPMYHAAPLRFTMAAQAVGATAVVMEHFDAEEYLKAVEKHKITHSQVVPTMFVRMLKLDDAVRAKYDVSSIQCVIHAAAPSPIPVKKKMIERTVEKTRS